MRYLLVIIAMLGLSACSLSPVKTTPLTRYTLNALPTKVVTAKSTRLTLGVATPLAEPGYATRQFAYSTKPHQLDYYANNQWVAPPASMLLPEIVRSLARTKHFRAVIGAPYTVSADVQLDTRLLKLRENFQHELPVIELEVQANLISLRRGRIIASKLFSIKEPVRETNPASAVLAANRASAKLLAALARFSVKATS